MSKQQKELLTGLYRNTVTRRQMLEFMRENGFWLGEVDKALKWIAEEFSFASFIKEIEATKKPYHYQFRWLPTSTHIEPNAYYVYMLVTIDGKASIGEYVKTLPNKCVEYFGDEFLATLKKPSMKEPIYFYRERLELTQYEAWKVWQRISHDDFQKYFRLKPCEPVTVELPPDWAWRYNYNVEFDVVQPVEAGKLDIEL